jgi:hypothetical protein
VGIDSDSVAEIAVTLTRQQSVNDQQRGVRFNIPALIPGGAAVVGSHNMLGGLTTIPLYKSDTFAFTVTSTAADDVLVSWNTLYNDLPGVSSVLASWEAGAGSSAIRRSGSPATPSRPAHRGSTAPAGR